MNVGGLLGERMRKAKEEDIRGHKTSWQLRALLLAWEGLLVGHHRRMAGVVADEIAIDVSHQSEVHQSKDVPREKEDCSDNARIAVVQRANRR